MGGYSECDRYETLRFNDRAEQYFRKFANVTFEINKPYSQYKEAALISYQVGLLLCGAKIGRAQRVMDFGSGSGWLASFVHRMSNEVHLLDISETALDIARNLFELDRRNAIHDQGPHFVSYDGFNFPFDDNYFDRIICFQALHHVPNPRRILEEMHRVLKSGGIAGFVESGDDHSRKPVTRDCVEKTGVLERDTLMEEVCKLAQQGGFSGMRIKAFPVCDEWEMDYECYRKKRDDGAPVVDIKAVEDSFRTGNQSVFFLHKGRFVKDGRYPGEPLARISARPTNVSCCPGEDITLHVVIENLGNTIFNAAPHPLGGFFTLGGHLRQGNRLVDYDLFHEPLPSDVECTATCSLKCTFRAPEIRGDYHVELDLVIEGVYWLGQHGSELCRIRMRVT